jgi:ectoine hydroxylase-related dioxygenase (phytanoyl-CoA dioxygenase family)
MLVKNDEYAREFAEHGVVRLQNALSTETIDHLKSITSSLYTRADEAARTGEPLGRGDAAKFIVSSTSEWGGMQLDAVQTFFSKRRFFTRSIAQPTAQRISSAASEIAALVSQLKGPGWHWRPSASYFRRQMKGHASTTHWHIDAEAASTLNLGKSCVTVWVPLIHVGGETDIPSLEFVRGSSRYTPSQWGELKLCTNRPDEWVATMPGERWTAEAFPGDILIFEQFTLHRTQNVATQSIHRTSCEFRFVLADTDK